MLQTGERLTNVPRPSPGADWVRARRSRSGDTHLTLPALRAGPLPLRPEGRRGIFDAPPRSAVEPPIFHAPAIVLAVDHDRDALELRLPAGRGTEVVDD